MSSPQQQITGNFNSNNKSFNTINSNNNTFNNINLFTDIDAKGRQIIRWLSPLEPQIRHHGIRTERLPGVGNGILETTEFRKWRDAKDGYFEPVLFCSGNPGVGKTYVR